MREADDEIDMELDVRWCGDANIVLGIDLPAGGEYTRLNPKVKDIVFVATIKVILKPLVDKIPGFAAAAVALKAPPIIKYRFDFGAAFGGSFTTAPIIAFVNFIVQEVIVGMLLWPNRVTVPILELLGPVDPDIALEVERLNGRQRGVVKVQVLAARELKAFDALTGKSDPLVELFTTPEHRCATRHISNNLAPQWNETFYLPVLEKDQVLRVEVFDHDAVNLKEAATLQVWKSVGNMIGAKEFMARAAVPLAPYIEDEGLDDETWFPLGRGDWTNLGGPGKGDGFVRLGLQYRAIENIGGAEISGASRGLLFASVIKAEHLASASGPKLSCFVGVKVGKVEHVTETLKGAGVSPAWRTKNKFTFYDVALQDEVRVRVVEPGLALSDELGSVALSLPDIVESCQVSRWTRKQQAGYLHKAFTLVDGDGATLELEFEFLPYW